MFLFSFPLVVVISTCTPPGMSPTWKSCQVSGSSRASASISCSARFSVVVSHTTFGKPERPLLDPGSPVVDVDLCLPCDDAQRLCGSVDLDEAGELVVTEARWTKPSGFSTLSPRRVRASAPGCWLGLEAQ